MVNAPSAQPPEDYPINPVIPQSEKRGAIDRLISAEAVYGRDANPLYDQVGDLDGIDIVEHRDYQADDKYRCEWFVFKNDDWWKDEDELGLDFGTMLNNF